MSDKKRVLLHICCAPCACYPFISLREEGFEPMGYWYNNNIHPYTEWVKRKEAVEQLAANTNTKIIYDEAYKPLEYFQSISFRESQRCFLCYQMRLEAAAHIARKGKFDYFSSSLLFSKHQRHQQIKELGEAAGEKYGVPFLYRDFREGYKEGGDISREMGLYRQQYCGCLYSEIERYAPGEIRKLVR